MKVFQALFVVLLFGWIACFCGYLVFANLLVSLAATQVPFGGSQILQWQLGVPMATYDEVAGYVAASGNENALVPTIQIPRTGASVSPGFLCGPPVLGPVTLTADFDDLQTYAPGYSPPSSGVPLHGGLDFAGAPGLPVISPINGVVIWAGPNGAYGDMVAVENDGYVAYLAHLDIASVVPGQAVSAGQVVGTLGQSGNATGPHVHYGVYGTDGQAVDPRLVLLPGQGNLCGYGD